MKSIYAIYRFDTEIRSTNGFFNVDEIRLTDSDMIDGETEGYYATKEEAEKAFSKLHSDARIVEGHGRFTLAEFVSYQLEENCIEDEDYDESASLEDNLTNAFCTGECWGKKSRLIKDEDDHWTEEED